MKHYDLICGGSCEHQWSWAGDPIDFFDQTCPRCGAPAHQRPVPKAAGIPMVNGCTVKPLRRTSYELAFDPSGRSEIAAEGAPSLAAAIQNDGSVKFESDSHRKRVYAEAGGVMQRYEDQKGAREEAQRHAEHRELAGSPLGKTMDRFLQGD